MLQLGGEAVLALRVGRRVRVGPGDRGVDERRPGARPHVGDGLLGQGADREVVGAVDGVDGQAGEPGHQLGHRRRGLLGRRDRDGVAVVGHHEQHRQVLGAGGVEALPELALRRGALAQAHVGDLVAVGGEAQLRPPHDVATGLGAPHRRQALRAGRARLRDDVGRAVAPVGRHLPPRGGRVGRGPDGLEQHLLGADPEAQHERQVAVVGEEPVVAGPQLPGEAEVERLVAGAGNLEEHPALLLQRDLAVVDRAGDQRQQHVVAQLVGRVGVGAGGPVLHDPQPGAGAPAVLRMVRRPRRLGSHDHPLWAMCPPPASDRYISVQDSRGSRVPNDL